TRLAYVVPYVGQVAHVGLGQRVEQVHGVARHAEPADQERIPALNETRRLGRGDHGGDLHALSFGSSTTVASPCPTPTHSVAKPERAGRAARERRLSSWTSVVRMRAPEHPSG